MLNLDHLNDEEREIIEAVILRDENERLREEQRVRKLKSELHQLRKEGAVKTGGEENGDEKVCHRCRKELGFFFDSGEICSKCNNKVCNDCQVFTPSGKKWLCTVCDKQLQIKLGSPNWIGEKANENESLPSLQGSQLIKVSLENSRANSTVTSVVDEGEDTRRYYEDDLSYTDEESESYGSEEPDHKKSPGRNVTFDSPLRQSAVPSDLDFDEEEEVKGPSDLLKGPDAFFLAYRSQASSESDLSVIMEDPEEEKPTQKTVSEESEEEGSTSTVGRQGDEQYSDGYPRPYPYPDEYQGDKQNVEADVHSNGENGSYVPPARKQKQVVDTTPNLRGDEWEQMLNGRLKDASEEEEEEEVTKEFKSVEAAAVEMENGRRLEEGKEGWKKGVGQQDQRVDEMDGRNALVEEDQGAEFDEAEAQRMEQVITQELDPEDSELVVINYNEITNSDTDIRHSEIVPINETTREEEKTLPMDQEGEEEEDVDGVIAEERIRQTEELAQEQVSKEEDVVENEKADEGSRSVTDGEQGTQTDGEADVHVDITADEVSHTLTAKANTLPADTSRVEPYGMDEGSSTMSRRDTGGALSKIKKDDFRKASRASLASLYSNADESYRLQVTGDVNFGTSYNYKTNTFEVKVLSCRDLVPVDAKRNRSNPYVKLYLLPDRSKQSKRKTSVRKSTINPVYSATLKYKIRQSELETRTLCVAVWHFDRFGHNLFLGEHLLSLDTVQFDDYSAKWHSLAQRQRKSTSALTYTGDVLVAVMYEPLSEDEEKDKSGRYHKGKKNRAPGRLLGGTLHVHIKEAKNLVGMKLGGSSSPVCKCYLLPDKTKHGKQKTTVKRNTCNPKWTDIIKFENVTRDSLLERCLEVTVWDFDSVGSNSLMGGVRLGLGSGKSYGKAVDWMDSSGKEVSVWREMLKHPNHWVETTMTLRGNVGKAKK
ncbi:synaptotagmin-like protein 5 isoform X2 [Apostichopus japonicus]|uniref:synaptotagmin-like protein 5 isoform X2 n=1 Tax=Stichopus japonicus TaxID=307972 RepID=UPI003AB3192D